MPLWAECSKQGIFASGYWLHSVGFILLSNFLLRSSSTLKIMANSFVVWLLPQEEDAYCCGWWLSTQRTGEKLRKVSVCTYALTVLKGFMILNSVRSIWLLCFIDSYYIVDRTRWRLKFCCKVTCAKHNQAWLTDWQAFIRDTSLLLACMYSTHSSLQLCKSPNFIMHC